VQNQLDPSDPDNHAHLMHRVTLGTEGGNLTLVNTHGPVVWSNRPRYPRDPRQDGSTPHFAGAGDQPGPVGPGPPVDPPTATPLGPPRAPGLEEIFNELWPAAVRRALLDVRRAAVAGEDPLRRGQYHLALCRLWHHMTTELGPPDLLRCDEPRELSPEDLRAMARATDDAMALP
jgi:pyochelin biosynthesis protein PchG